MQILVVIYHQTSGTAENLTSSLLLCLPTHYPQEVFSASYGSLGSHLSCDPILALKFHHLGHKRTWHLTHLGGAELSFPGAQEQLCQSLCRGAGHAASSGACSELAHYRAAVTLTRRKEMRDESFDND